MSTPVTRTIPCPSGQTCSITSNNLDVVQMWVTTYSLTMSKTKTDIVKDLIKVTTLTEEDRTALSILRDDQVKQFNRSYTLLNYKPSNLQAGDSDEDLEEEEEEDEDPPTPLLKKFKK